MKISKLFPKKYASGADLQGKPIKATLSHVHLEIMHPTGRQEEEKPVLYVTGAQKGIILTATLARQIVALTGADDTAQWKGKIVVLYPVPMNVAGQDRIAIRARAHTATNGVLPATTALADPTELAATDEEMI